MMTHLGGSPVSHHETLPKLKSGVFCKVKASLNKPWISPWCRPSPRFLLGPAMQARSNVGPFFLGVASHLFQIPDLPDLPFSIADGAGRPLPASRRSHLLLGPTRPGGGPITDGPQGECHGFFQSLYDLPITWLMNRHSKVIGAHYRRGVFFPYGCTRTQHNMTTEHDSRSE